MMHFKRIMTLTGERVDLAFEGKGDVDASSLLLLPAVIDPHVHFRAPGNEHKEDWRTAASAAVAGGVATVFDMPNNNPSCVTIERLIAKKKLIDSQLQEVGIPLNYHLYLGADQNHLEEIEKAAGHAIGIKVFMGSSTGTLLIDDQSSLEKIFASAAKIGLPVAVHAEDETILQAVKQRYPKRNSPKDHTIMRPRAAAIAATVRAIDLARRHKTTLYLLHVNTREELELIRQAKSEGLAVFAEVTPHHLFLNENDYDTFGNFVQMNPPLRREEDCEALWEALRDGTIDTVGTDHAPHTKEEKMKPYGEAPSGIPGVETVLPLMLDAANQGKISLARLVAVMSTNIEKIFKLEPQKNYTIVDLGLEKKVVESEILSKCGWSAYAGRKLRGWPLYTIIRGKVLKRQDILAAQCKGRERSLANDAGSSL